MPKGAIYPRSSNFTRWLKPNIVARMRKFASAGVFPRPRWMALVERTPPLELQEIHMNSHHVKNLYPPLVAALLRKYPNLRFQDCFVQGNNFAKGQDKYRDDHPVMQFCAHQLQLMQSQGLSQKEAFVLTERAFYEHRMQLERDYKVHHALQLSDSIEPLFTSAEAYWQTEIAKRQERQFSHYAGRFRLLHSREKLRRTIAQLENGTMLPSQVPKPIVNRTSSLYKPATSPTPEECYAAYRRRRATESPETPALSGVHSVSKPSDALSWSAATPDAPLHHFNNRFSNSDECPTPRRFGQSFTRQVEGKNKTTAYDALLDDISHMVRQKYVAPSPPVPDPEEPKDLFDDLVQNFATARNIRCTL